MGFSMVWREEKLEKQGRKGRKGRKRKYEEKVGREVR